MSQASDIKTRIKALLDELVVSNDLAEVIVDDFKTSFDKKDIAAYPVAILSTPSVESEILTNRQNVRAYTFEVVVIMKGEDISGTDDVENLMETVLNKFDNDPTLNGKAEGGLEPSTSTPAPVTSGDNSYIVFSLFLRAKAIIDLTF